MVEKMTKEEALIQRTIDVARVAKELLERDINQIEYCPETEETELKRPKAEDDETEVENNTGTHSGYGLAGDTNE